MRDKLLAMIPFLLLTLSCASCTEKGIAGRVYKGVYDDSNITVSFSKDGFARVEIDERKLKFEYKTHDMDSIKANLASIPEEKYEWKYDDDSLLFDFSYIAMVLDRTDSGKRTKTSKKVATEKNSIEGRTYQGKYEDSLVTLYFKKFGLLLITSEDTTEHFFYKDDAKTKTVRLRVRYSYLDDEDDDTLNYDDYMLWGTLNGEEIVLEDLDRKIEASYAAKTEDDSYDEDVATPSEKSEQKKRKTTRELTPPKEKHTKTYDTLVKYGFRTMDGDVDPDYIRVSNSLLRPDESGIIGFFLHDDGKNCFLDRKNITSYGRANSLKCSTHVDITDCIKEILYATEGSTLRHAFVLIECKEPNSRNILLQNIHGKNMYGDYVQDKILAEIDKGYSLEDMSSELMNAVKNNSDFYYRDNFKWFIETE